MLLTWKFVTDLVLSPLSLNSKGSNTLEISQATPGCLFVFNGSYMTYNMAWLQQAS